jgi:uncharacterized protein YdeI (YjbR/CyaY-like superfamily)
MKSFNSTEEYLDNHPEWQECLMLLRDVLLELDVEEEIKWGAPVYTVKGKNIIGLGAFKSYIGIWFFQGSFLSDPEKVLINVQKGVTKSMRQWRFQSMDEMDIPLIRSYALEAIENEWKGLRVKLVKKELVIPQELQSVLKGNDALNKAFYSFKSGKQKEFAEYIIDAKKPQTKIKRIEKIIALIGNGIGLNNKHH